ncbi:2-dehydropantoate 2-reductase [Glaciecola sp. XM2]|uniref:2-dehydropantoate 2-reductase n=1 Tax=Glaciecola sp. XM2 TaxID=1914931 RepID=UPI001BDEE2EB|nr:2-dehydropantoate 2-reductase [Glaciecola sp. XM2]MBT1449736.1 2-dehydropantoate 2-reductase [Glaciecola sp. XM2]
MSATLPHHNAHHIVFGAGLIGCYVGGNLVLAQQKVSLIGRPTFLKQLNTHFELADYLGHKQSVSPIPELFDVQQAHAKALKADVLWITVKCTALNEAMSDIRDLVTKNTLIICCQNGVGNHNVVENAFPHNQVIRAMVPFNVVNDGKGTFHRGSQGNMTLEVVASAEETTKWLARQLNSDLLPVSITYHMTALQWAKMQLNLSNAVNAMADIPVKEMLQTRLYRQFISLLMDELLLVTTKQKIKLPKIANLPNKWIPKVLRLPNSIFALVAQKMIAVDPKVKLSMWWDLDQGRKTEVDFINGKVVDKAHQLDISAPANEWMLALIHDAEQGKRLSAEQFKAAVAEFLHNRN